MLTPSRWLNGAVPALFVLLVASDAAASGQQPMIIRQRVVEVDPEDAGTAPFPGSSSDSATPSGPVSAPDVGTGFPPSPGSGSPGAGSSSATGTAAAPVTSMDTQAPASDPTRALASDGSPSSSTPPADAVQANSAEEAPLPDAGVLPETLAEKRLRLREFLSADPNAPQALARAEATAASAPAMVVGGGISLGAYQAGFLSALARFWSVAAREAPDQPFPGPRVWTGASSGALNALLGGLAACDPSYGEAQWSPERSLFWRVWIQELDLERLLPAGPEAAASRQAQLFDSAHLEALVLKLQEAATKTRFRPHCSFAFGVTVTNLSGRRIPFGSAEVGSRAALDRVTEQVVVQVLTDAAGKLSARLPYLSGSASAPLPHLELQPDEQTYYPALGGDPTPGKPVELRALVRAPLAAAAFPVAFAPLPLPLTFFDSTSWQPIPGSSFVDGGSLHNNPLALAQRLSRRWVAPASQGFAAADYPILYLDHDVVDWRWKQTPTPLSLGPLAQTYLPSGGLLLRASRDRGVLAALEEDPDLSRRIKIPRRSSVLPSEFRSSLLGFADRHFREHDFFRGMVDAVRFLRTQLSASDSVQRLWPDLAGLSAEDADRRIRERLAISSPGFRCLSEGVCGEEHAPAVMPPPLFALRTAADALTGVAKDGQLREDDLDALLTALGAAHYRYHPGALCEDSLPCPASGGRADLLPLRRRVGAAVQELISHQPTLDAWMSRPVSGAVLDEWLTYSPPTDVFTFHLGRARGLGVGLERPLPKLAFESVRSEERYDRWEFRLGGQLSGLGVVDTDQLAVDELRLRLAGLQLYLDRVSDLDGFNGALPFLALGPNVRWRVGVGLSASYVTSTAQEAHGFAVQLPELRLGLDLFERVGLRLGVPLLVIRGGTDVPTALQLPHFYRDLSLGVELLLTRW
ncbi:MAG: patatin-like phospholipase family protein [Myxococcota bacterium]|nr:patatin-like phospholipase family protein [Myxococcota bacterium]